ncbi:hypothetical protein HanIR_Chr07g0322201 [Helianthus annuus]|nr:hypothetical protein HanIR_Chr07g0322201 [Helianthus annuus]
MILFLSCIGAIWWLRINFEYVRTRDNMARDIWWRWGYIGRVRVANDGESVVGRDAWVWLFLSNVTS